MTMNNLQRIELQCDILQGIRRRSPRRRSFILDGVECGREKSLTMYPLGGLPREDDPDLPKIPCPGLEGKRFQRVRFLAWTQRREGCLL
jgi:hypothetical protein